MNKNEAISKLWGALVEIEDYLSSGMFYDFQEPTPKRKAVPIRNAQNILKETEPFVPESFSHTASSLISYAAQQFNKFQSAQVALLIVEEKERAETIRTVLKRNSEFYMEHLQDLKKTIPSLLEENTMSKITIKGDNYGSMNYSEGDINSHIMNITLSELVKKIDDSNLGAEEKESIKKKINDLISHPLLTSILGGISGGIVG